MANIRFWCSPRPIELLRLSGGLVGRIASFDFSELGTNTTVISAQMGLTNSVPFTDGTYGVKTPYITSQSPGYSQRYGACLLAENGTLNVLSDVERAMADGGLMSTRVSLIAGARDKAFAQFYIDVTVDGAIVTDVPSDGELSAERVEFGQSITLTITPPEEKADVYSHNVMWRVNGSDPYTQHLDIGVTSASFAPPMNWLSQVPNSTEGDLTVTLETIADGSPVGVREYSAKVTVPANIGPSVGALSASAVNTGAIADNTRQYFAGASRIAFTLSGVSPGTGSSIASIVIGGWGDSVTTTQTSVTTGIVQTAGMFNITATVTDMRGRTAVATGQITVDQYSAPYFTSLSWIRCRQDGSPDDKGNSVTVNAVFGCSTDILDQNTAEASVALCAKGSGNWSAEIPLTSGQDTLITVMELLTTISYEMRFTVSDRVMSVVRYVTIPSNQFMLHFANNGASIGIGQAAEALGAGETGRAVFNRDWDIYLGENIHIGSQTLAEYIQSIVTAMQGS